MRRKEDIGSESAKEPNRKRGLIARMSKRAKVTVVVIVAVVAAGGVGFVQWHGTPEFCGAICHDPMDAYVANYTTGEYDVYGNKMGSEAESQAMAAYLHKVSDSITCLDCHDATVAEQLAEGRAWLTGDYETAGTNAQGQTYLYDLTGDELVQYRGITADEFCLKEGCHTDLDGNDVLTRDQLTELTEYLGDYNPHLFDGHYGVSQCTDCHKAHSQSVNMCTDCHDEAPVPNGWLTAEERRQIEAAAFGTDDTGATRTAAEEQAAQEFKETETQGK